MKQYICERQDGFKDCGVCCLLTILKTHGGNISKEYLRDLTHTSKDGTNFYFLMEAGRKLGFDVMAVEGDFRKLQKESFPCIAHVRVNQSYYHFVVIHDISFAKEYLVVADPAIGIRTISFSEFDRLQLKHYLLFEKSRPIINHTPKKMIVPMLWNLLFSTPSIFLSFFGFSFLSVGFGMISSFAFSFLQQEVILLFSFSHLIFLAFLLLGCYLFQTVSSFLHKKLSLWFYYYLQQKIFPVFFRKLWRLPFSYYKNRTSAEIYNRLHDLEMIQSFFSELLAFLSFDFLFLIVAFLLLFAIEPLLAGWILGISILLLFGNFLFQKPLKEKMFVWKMQKDNFDTYFLERVRGMETLRNHQKLTSSMETGMEKHLLCSQKYYQLSSQAGIYQMIQSLLERAMLFGIFIFGGYFILEGKMALSNLLFFYSMFQMLSSSLQRLGSIFLSFQNVQIAIERVDDILQMPEEREDKNRHLACWRWDIAIRHLSYQYLEHHKVLEDISLQIPMGSRIFFSGPSGSGKTTLARLLRKDLEIESHCISYGGYDINHFSCTYLQNHICYISQNEIIFTGSVFDNVTLGDPISYELFLEVAHLCELDFCLKKSHLGYDLLLEEDGSRLSGGERDRIILARALLRDYDIYILDEVFRQMDDLLERRILEKIFARYPNKTFIVLSHHQRNKDLFTDTLSFS